MRGYCVRALTKLAGVFIYDYVLTFVQEVQLIWHRRITGATVLFVLNRYAILAASLASIVQLLPWDVTSRGVKNDGPYNDAVSLDHYIIIRHPLNLARCTHFWSCKSV